MPSQKKPRIHRLKASEITRQCQTYSTNKKFLPELYSIIGKGEGPSRLVLIMFMFGNLANKLKTVLGNQSEITFTFLSIVLNVNHQCITFCPGNTEAHLFMFNFFTHLSYKFYTKTDWKNKEKYNSYRIYYR